jgi:hypothetical protein
VTGTKLYETVAGGSKTIFVLEPASVATSNETTEKGK